MAELEFLKNAARLFLLSAAVLAGITVYLFFYLDIGGILRFRRGLHRSRAEGRRKKRRDKKQKEGTCRK